MTGPRTLPALIARWHELDRQLGPAPQVIAGDDEQVRRLDEMAEIGAAIAATEANADSETISLREDKKRIAREIRAIMARNPGARRR